MSNRFKPDLAQIIVPALLAWWDAGHTPLPWRQTNDPYAIWVAEVMLQQTQIATVIPYYHRWLARFPTIHHLASASLEEVLKQWEGLGYYSRARHLHTAAQQLVSERGGQLPDTVKGLLSLKGVGRYTAGAIASIAFARPEPILDGNIIRILTRLCDLPDDIQQTATKNKLWAIATAFVPATRPGDFNQALMELGQHICLPVAPQCPKCPLQSHCLANQRATQTIRPVRSPRPPIPHYQVAAGVIWNQDNHFLIAQRPPNGLLGGLWEFPGGKQEAGESLPQTLQREIKEELDIQIEVGEHLVSIKHAYTHFRITLHAYHARYVSGRVQHLGVANHAWVRLPQLAQYPFALTDRKIITALDQWLTHPPPAA